MNKQEYKQIQIIVDRMIKNINEDKLNYSDSIVYHRSYYGL